MEIIPEKYLDLLQQKKAFASLATTMSDGSPQVTPVWFDYKDGIVRVNTAKGRVKARNLKEGAAVALCRGRFQLPQPIMASERVIKEFFDRTERWPKRGLQGFRRHRCRA